MNGGFYSELEAFEAILTRGSFTGAAKSLGVTTGAITRRLNSLETRLGVKLLSRSTRHLNLTESGRLYYTAIAPALLQIESAANLVHDRSKEPSGELRVSLPMNFGRLYVTPHLPTFMRRWPGIELDAHFDDRFVDLIAEGFDLAIRIGALSDSRLVARRLADTRRILVASPDYLARRGIPKRPIDLASHDCLHYTHFRNFASWEFRRGREELHIPVRGRLKSNYGVPLVDAAVHGDGIVQSATFAVATELADGRLQEVLPDWNLLPIGVYAVYPSRDYRPRQVEAFVQFLEEVIGRPALWDRLIDGTITTARASDDRP
jgi:DNA-binding transcriptional LysR family regulator